jgi:hypothetical protein
VFHPAHGEMSRTPRSNDADRQKNVSRDPIPLFDEFLPPRDFDRSRFNQLQVLRNSFQHLIHNRLSPRHSPALR